VTRILITVAEPGAEQIGSIASMHGTSVLPVDLPDDQIENLKCLLMDSRASDLRWLIMPRPDDGGDAWLNVDYIIRIDFPKDEA
jgi:hypothetical protein